LRLIKAEKIPCLPLTALNPSPDPTNLIKAAITDNLERGLNQAELSLAWDLVKREAPKEAWPEMASLLGFSLHGQKPLALEKAALLPKEALPLLAQGKLDPENALVLADWPIPGQSLALGLIGRASPSKQNRRLWLEWLDDLRRAQGNGALLETLSSPALKDLSGPLAEKMARDHIRALRFPYLTKLERKRQEILKSLALPEGFKLELDPNFEDVSATIKITFSDALELKSLATVALSLAREDTLERLWALRDPAS
jgi:hypothetical protein